jgi:hypothetical protein
MGVYYGSSSLRRRIVSRTKDNLYEKGLGNNFNTALLNIPFSFWINLYDALRSALQDSAHISAVALRHSVHNITHQNCLLIYNYLWHNNPIRA